MARATKEGGKDQLALFPDVDQVRYVNFSTMAYAALVVCTPRIGCVSYASCATWLRLCGGCPKLTGISSHLSFKAQRRTAGRGGRPSVTSERTTSACRLER